MHETWQLCMAIQTLPTQHIQHGTDKKQTCIHIATLSFNHPGNIQTIFFKNVALWQLDARSLMMHNSTNLLIGFLETTMVTSYLHTHMHKQSKPKKQSLQLLQSSHAYIVNKYWGTCASFRS